MKNLIQRTITGVFFVGIILFCIGFGKYSFIILFFLIVMLGLWEFYSLAERTGLKPQKLAGTTAGCAFFLIGSLYYQQLIPRMYLIIILLLLFIIPIFELYKKTSQPLVNICVTLGGIFYLCIPLVLLNHLTYPPPLSPDFVFPQYNPNILLGFFFLSWANDTFAYIFGINFGKHKLFESVSPNKTWEGSFAGAVFCLITAHIISLYFNELFPMHWYIMALIVIIFGTLGDLVQSKLKRNMNVKDSGKILPGHGGILDRFDGIFIAAPFVFAFIQYLK